MYVFIAIGAFIGYILKGWREKVLQTSTKAIIYCVTPILIFISLVNTEITLSITLVLGIIFVQLSMSCLMMLIAFLALRNRSWMTGKKLGGYLLIAAFPNATVFPIPIVLAVWGESFLTLLFLYSSSALVLRGTLGTYTSIKYGRGEGKIPVKQTLVKVITFPPTIAIILAIIFIGFNAQMPNEILAVIKTPLSKLTSWFGAIVIGMILAGLQRKRLHEFKKDVLISSMLRFLLPFLYFVGIAIFLIFPDNNQIVKSILLLEVMGPPAIFNAMFAVNFDLDREFVATMVVLLTLMMLIIAPLLILLSPLIF